MIRKVIGIYYSPVGGTARMTETLTRIIAEVLDECSPYGVESEVLDLLRLGDSREVVLDDETVAVVGMPVYVGKVPLPGVRALQKVRPQGAITVAAVSYGARTYGNALYELQHSAEDNGFKVIGAGAFCVKYRGRSATVNIDATSLDTFGNAAAAKIKRLAGCEVESLKIKPAPLEVDGRLPVHRISRISPWAAATAQEFLERICIRRKESEWYL
jgi:hypothetical protein